MENKNNKGFTLIELIVSIAVASIVLIILMQMLFMSVQAKNYTYINSTLQTEAYLLAEDIRFTAFNHETQYVAIDKTDPNLVKLILIHRYDIGITSGGAIGWEDVPEAERNIEIVFNKNDNTIYKSTDGINYTAMHSPNIYFESAIDQETTFDVESVDAVCDPANPPALEGGCEDVVITLTLYISVYENGALVDIQEFVTTIII